MVIENSINNSDLVQAYKTLNLKLQSEESENLFSKNFQVTNLEEKITQFLINEKSEIQKRIQEEFLGLGPLQALTLDPDIDEILVIGHQTIIYEKKGQLIRYNDSFLSEHSFFRVIDLLSKNFFKAISFENPTGNGYWDDYRVHIISPPLSSVYNLSLRKKGSLKINSLQKLLEIETLTKNEFNFLQDALLNKKNILISGSTSSGKTTFIQCLLNLVAGERCLILEDTQELDLPNHYSAHLVCPAREEQYQIAFSMQDLVKEALRMRPDRLILGEARGSEAKDYIQALSTGHRGCIASLHAASPKEALFRLECLILQGAPQWSAKVVRQLIASGIDYVLQLERKENGQRKLTEMVKVCGLEEDSLLIEPVFFS